MCLFITFATYTYNRYNIYNILYYAHTIALFIVICHVYRKWINKEILFEIAKQRISHLSVWRTKYGRASPIPTTQRTFRRDFGQREKCLGDWLKLSESSLHGGFLKWWYPTTMGFPTKNDHFGVFWGYHYFRKHLHIWMNNISYYNPYLLRMGKMFYFLVGKMFCFQAD